MFLCKISLLFGNLVVILCFIFVDCEAKNHEIHLRKNDNKEKYYVFEKGDSITVFLEGFNATNLRCLNNKNYRHPATGPGGRDFIYEVFFQETSTSADIPEVTDEMNTRWVCIVYEIQYKVSTNQYPFYLMVQVPGARMIHININEMALLPVPSNNTALSVDGVAQYEFTDGESVEYSCDDPFHSNLQLIYYDVNDTKIFETEKVYEWSLDKLHFRSVMHLDNNGSYIDCICAPNSTDEKHTYRTYFRLKSCPSLDKNVLNITVNGLRLVPKPVQTDSNSLEYRYTFSSNDNITIICEKASEETNGTVEFDLFPHDFDIIRDGSATKQKLELKVVSDIMYHSKILRCELANTTVDYKPADIHLFKDETLLINSIRILGLPPSNIKLQYDHNSSIWYTVYEYSEGEILDIQCVAAYREDHTLKWIFEGEDLETNNLFRLQVHVGSLVLSRIILGQFTLDASHDMSVIACTAAKSQNSAIIVLQQKHGLLPVVKREYTRSMKKILSIILIVGSITILVGGIVVLYLLYRRRRNKLVPEIRAIAMANTAEAM